MNYTWVVLIFLVLVWLNTERQATAARRDVARLDRKVDALLAKLGVDYGDVFGLSERVREIARDPSRKIEAIKAYREETGAGLAEAKDAVEGFTNSLRR